MAAITTAGSGNWSSTTPNAPWPGGTLVAERERKAPETHIHVAPPHVEVRNEAPVVNVAAPAVTIEPAAVEVRAELVLPEQEAPVVNVNVELPEELRIASLPDRKTTTEIIRNGAGEIIESTQTERDA